MKNKLKQVISGTFKSLGLSCLLAMIYLLSCSGTPAKKETEAFVKRFEKEVGVRAEGVSIYFTDLRSPTAGRCFPGLKIIQLDLKHYKNLSIIEKKALVYHELGHCVCNIFVHTEESTFCGDSIMVPTMLSKWCYRTRWGVYMKDLRKRCR